MKRLTTLSALLLTAALISGCDSGMDDDPTVTGRWSGTMQVLGNSVTVTMDLLEEDLRVTGTGTVGTFASVLTGTHRFPDVSLTSSTTGLLDSHYSATLSDNGRTITGTWTEPGVVTALVLRKSF